MKARALLFAAGLASWGAAAAPVAEVAAVEGRGEHREAQQAAWRPAKVTQGLNASDFVRTLDLSKMAIVFADRTRLQLSPNSTLQIKGGGADARTTVNLNGGRAWTTSKVAPRGLTMETPGATAAIRGTEWEMVVDEAGRATLTVFSGEVDLFNEHGSVVVGPNEQAQAERGRAPVKLTLRVSRERVQWVSSYRIDAARYNARSELPEIASLVEEQKLADAYARLKPLAGTRASAALLLADFEIYRGDLAAARTVLDAGAARFPEDERFDVLRARTALFDDRAADALAAAQAATTKRAASPEAWLVLGEVHRHEGRAREALAAYGRAASLASGDSRPWRGLGAVEGERENIGPARAHLGKAIANDPRDAEALAELATVDGFAGDVDRARERIRAALALEPANYVAWTALGVIELRAGHVDAATDALSRAAAIEPRYARAHLYLAAAHYRIAGDAAAFEELRRAAELDPNDPMPYFLASLVYTDRIEPGLAAIEAQRALERLPFLKSMNQVANNQRGVANAGYPLAQMGLEAWARSAAYESYLPSWGGSHFFLADRYPGDFNRRSELLQGFIADPLVFGSSNRFQSLFLQPGHHATLTLRADTSDDVTSFEPAVVLNGYRAGTRPFAYYVEASELRAEPRDAEFEGTLRRFTGALGWRPRHDLSVFVYANRLDADVDNGPKEGSGTLDRISGRLSRADLGLGYAPDARSRLWVRAGTGTEHTVNRERSQAILPGVVIVFDRRFETRPRTDGAAARYTVDWSDALEVTVGAEASRRREEVAVQQDASAHFAGTGIPQQYLAGTFRDRSDSAYAIARMRSGRLRLEAGLTWHDYVTDRVTSVRQDQRPDFDATFFERYPRKETMPLAGVVWQPGGGLLLRAACRRWIRPIAIDTLMPIAVAGVPLDDQLVFAGGELDQCRGQAEWTIAKRTFASVAVERIETNNQVSLVAGAVLHTGRDLSNLERLRNRVRSEPSKPDELEDTPSYAGGNIRRAHLALEHIVTPRIAARLHYAYAQSENNDPIFAGLRVPYLPRHLVNLGLTWSPGWRTFVTLQAIHRSRRFADESNIEPLPAGWDGQVTVYAETPDKRWAIEARALNVGKKEIPERFGIVLSYRF